MLAVAVCAILPMAIFALMIGVEILKRFENNAVVSSSSYLMLLVVLFILGFMGWVLSQMLQRKLWARTLWVVMCGLLPGLSLILGVALFPIFGYTTVFFLLIFCALYAFLGFYLYFNYHIDTYFGKMSPSFIDKIAEIGNNETI